MRIRRMFDLISLPLLPAVAFFIDIEWRIGMDAIITHVASFFAGFAAAMCSCAVWFLLCEMLAI